MPEAARSRSDVKARIVEVAARLLRESGPAAVTTRAVAEAAGVQAPAIYRLFGDKEGLLDAVAEHVMTVAVEIKTGVVEAAAAQGVDPLEDLRAGWQTQIDFGLANPTLFGLLIDPERALRSPAYQAGRRVLEARVHRLAAAGRLRVGEQHTVALIQAAGTGAVLTLLSTPLRHRDAGLADTLWEAVLRQVLADPPETREDRPLVAAVALRAVAPRLQALSPAEQQLMLEWLDRVIEAS